MSDEVVAAVSSLAATTLALLAGDEAAATALAGSAQQKREKIKLAFSAYDHCGSGTLACEEAKALFTKLARSIVEELAASASTRDTARKNARRILDDDDKRGIINRVATKLLLLADVDGDGRVNLMELSNLFDTVQRAQNSSPETFPQPLRALAGSLQLLPPGVGKDASEAEHAAEWHVGVPGDDHTLRLVDIGKGLSVVGLGRSADASAYFLPELGIVFDAGIHVKSLQPKCVLLTHGHRDHTSALPTMAQHAKVLAPKAIASLVRRFLLAEAQLNFGNEAQTDDETVTALGDFDVDGVEDKDEILLPRSCYAGSPTPIGVQVFSAPHKGGVPAVSYGLFRAKSRIKPEYATLPKNELGKLLRDEVLIKETYNEGILFYTGDTTIDLLRGRWAEIFPKYKHIIHEVTFFGPPSDALDDASREKGHTHYAQLHPFVLAFPETTFICVHWSLKYSKDDILDFFRGQYGGVPSNVVLWV
jgi:ribonuclease Z